MVGGMDLTKQSESCVLTSSVLTYQLSKKIVFVVGNHTKGTSNLISDASGSGLRDGLVATKNIDVPVRSLTSSVVAAAGSDDGGLCFKKANCREA